MKLKGEQAVLWTFIENGLGQTDQRNFEAKKKTD